MTGLNTGNALNADGGSSPLTRMLTKANEIAAQAAEVERLRIENESLRCRIDELTDGGSLEQQLREVRQQLLAERSRAERLRAALNTARAKAEGGRVL